MQRTATPCTPVRFRPAPPLKFARVVKLVDTGDLKSPDRKIVPVRVRSRAPLFVVNFKPRKLTLSGFFVVFFMYAPVIYSPLECRMSAAFIGQSSLD